MAHWSGLDTSAAKLAISAVSWFKGDEWFTFVVTSTGTILAYVSGAIQQWFEEKYGVPRLDFEDTSKDKKAVYLTKGNGTHDALPS